MSRTRHGCIWRSDSGTEWLWAKDQGRREPQNKVVNLYFRHQRAPSIGTLSEGTDAECTSKSPNKWREGSTPLTESGMIPQLGETPHTYTQKWKWIPTVRTGQHEPPSQLRGEVLPSHRKNLWWQWLERKVDKEGMRVRWAQGRITTPALRRGLLPKGLTV